MTPTRPNGSNGRVTMSCQDARALGICRAHAQYPRCRYPSLIEGVSWSSNIACRWAHLYRIARRTDRRRGGGRRRRPRLPQAANSRKRPAIAPGSSRSANSTPRPAWSEASRWSAPPSSNGSAKAVGPRARISVHRVPRADLKEFLDRKRAEGCGGDVRLLLLLGQDIIAGE